MRPHVSIGQLLRLSHLSLHHLHRGGDGGRAQQVRRTVGPGEAAEGRRVRHVIIVEVLYESPTASTSRHVLLVQLGHQLLDVLDQCGAHTEQTEQQ